MKYVLQYGYFDVYVNSHLRNNQSLGILIENIWLSYSFLSLFYFFLFWFFFFPFLDVIVVFSVQF